MWMTALSASFSNVRLKSVYISIVNCPANGKAAAAYSQQCDKTWRCVLCKDALESGIAHGKQHPPPYKENTLSLLVLAPQTDQAIQYMSTMY